MEHFSFCQTHTYLERCMQVLDLLSQHCKVFPLIEKKEHFFVKLYKITQCKNFMREQTSKKDLL